MSADSANLQRSGRGLWRVAGLPVLLLLVILEPLVTFVLAALSLLGLLTTAFFYLVGPPEFPVWTMLALSLAFAIAFTLPCIDSIAVEHLKAGFIKRFAVGD